jgi:hypothetical protein
MENIINLFIGLMAVMQSFNLWLAMQTSANLTRLQDQFREHELDRKVHK